MTTPELTKWLRENSSGVYRPAAEAADLIERLEAEKNQLMDAWAQKPAKTERTENNQRIKRT